MATFDFTEKVPKPAEDSQKKLTEYYDRMGKWCDHAYEEASTKQSEVQEIKDIEGTLNYLVGLQWKEALPSYRAKPVSNDFMSNFWETIGLLTDIKPAFSIKEITMEDKYSKTQAVLNKCARGWAKQSLFNRKMAFWTMFAMMTTSPCKIYWNPFAHGDSGSPSDGDISMEVLPPTALLRLGVGKTYEDDEMLIYRHVRTLNWIKRAFPRMGKFVRPEDAVSKYTYSMAGPVTVSPQFFQTLSPGFQRLMGGGAEKTSLPSVFPMAEVREYWMKDDTYNESRNTIWVGPEGAPWAYQVKPGEKVYPRGRLVIRANGVTLYDEPNMYFHRRKPFVPLALYAVPWQDYALSVMKPWMSQQDILNQIMAGLLNNVKKALNPALMAPKSAIHPEALKQIDANKPGLKVSYNSNASTAPTWQQPPNIPAYVFNAYSIVQKAMRQMSGSEAMGDALGKKQVPGGDTLERINFSKTTPIRHMGGNIETSVDELGMMWTGNALQFYDAAKRTELLGIQGLTKEDLDDAPGSMIPSGINSEAYVRQFHFECERGSLLNIQRQDKIQLAIAMRKGRDLSRKKFFKIIDWNINEEENDAELAAEAAAMPAPAKGHK